MDTRRARIYNGSKKVDAIYKGPSATPMYTWEEEVIMVGMPERIPYTTQNSYDSSLLKWEGYVIPGSDGYRVHYGNVDVINGKQVGSATDVYPEISTPPKPQTNVVGTKQLDESYEKSQYVTVDAYASTSEHPIRRKLNIKDFRWPVGSEVVVTYRVTGGGVNNSNTSGQIRFKQEGENIVNLANFTAIVDKTDLDSSRNPLCIIIASMQTSAVTHFAEYIALFFEQNLRGGIYDVSVYLEEGENTLENIIGAPVMYESYVSSNNGNTYYRFYYPLVGRIYSGAEYIVRTRSTPTQSIELRHFHVNNQIIVNTRDKTTIESGNKSGVTVKGLDLELRGYSAFTTQYGFPSAPPDSHYLEILRVP